MSSKYLTHLVHSVTGGLSRLNEESMHFCLYNHFSHFCFRVFSIYLLNYASSHTLSVDSSKKAACVAMQFLQLTRGDESLVHLIQALCMNALIHTKLGVVDVRR
jgi:hypothetical protein